MVNLNFSETLMNVLKEHAKREGITQKQLAEKMQVSVPTIKRWLCGDGITLLNLGEMCKILGLSLSDIAAQIDDSNKKGFYYTEKQENFLAKNPSIFAFFDYLLKGYSPQKIQLKFKLKEIQTYLSKLDKIELIEWLPADRVKLLVEGEPVWRANGALVKKYKPQIWNEFIAGRGASNSSFHLHDYAKEDLEKIKVKTSELLELAKSANRKSSISSQKNEPYGLFICMRKYRWNLDQYLK